MFANSFSICIPGRLLVYYGFLELLGSWSFLIILLLAVLWAYVVRKIISVAM